MLVSKDVRDGEEILDMFAGIGPFSLSIARWHNCTIHAIDSNPDAVYYMQQSIQLNQRYCVRKKCGKAGFLTYDSYPDPVLVNPLIIKEIKKSVIYKMTLQRPGSVNIFTTGNCRIQT